jgi:hypothetical protein
MPLTSESRIKASVRAGGAPSEHDHVRIPLTVQSVDI